MELPPDIVYDGYLNNMPDDRYPDHIKIILLDDFLSFFRVEKKIRDKITELNSIIEDCLQMKDLRKQEEALNRLEELSEKAKLYLKLPLSQMRLDEILGM